MRALRAHILDAYLNGASLRAADGRIRVTNIRQEISLKDAQGESGAQEGRWFMPPRRETLSVTIEFGLLEIHDPAAREAAVEAANAWAGEGQLEISTKPGRRLLAACRKWACVQSPQNPKETFALTFETDQSPFWEAITPSVYTLSGSSGSQEVFVPGSAPAMADVTVTPRSGTLNQLTLSLGETSMQFADLGASASAPLVLDHDERGRLRIRVGSQSAFPCRAGESDDELLAPPGRPTASFAANVSCDVTFSFRPRYR